jgi:hypothetical protein
VTGHIFVIAAVVSLVALAISLIKVRPASATMAHGEANKKAEDSL